MNVVVFNTDIRTRNQYIPNAIFRSIKRSDFVEHCWLATVETLFDVVSAAQHPIILCIGGSGAPMPLLAEVRPMASLCVLWTTEDPYEIERNRLIADFFDYIFTNEITAVNRYPKGKCKYLPLASCKEVHYQPVGLSPEENIWDVFFVGTLWPNRLKDLQEISQRLGGSGLKLKFGLPTNPYIPQQRLQNPNLFTNFRLSPHDFARFANKSAVTLVIDREFGVQNDAERPDSPPPRVYEAALAGACQIYLTDRDSEGSILPSRVFKRVSSTEDLVNSALRLAGNWARRSEIATAAQKWALDNHTYDNRALQLVEAFKELLAEGQELKGTKREESGKKTVLHVAHNDVSQGSFGGVERYLRTLQRHLPSNHDVLILYPSAGRLSVKLSGREHGLIKEWMTSPANPNALFDPEIEVIFQEILTEHRIDVVHFHHLLNLSLSLPRIAAVYGAYSILTVHDYYMVCDSFTLTDERGEFCGIKGSGYAKCDGCSKGRIGASEGAVYARRKFCEWQLSFCGLILHNTEDSLKRFMRVFPRIAPEKHLVMGMTADPALLSYFSLRSEARQLHKKLPTVERFYKQLKVAIVGNFSQFKGGAAYLDIMSSCAPQGIDFLVVGRVDDEYVEPLADLVAKFSNIKLMGEYNVTDLPEILDDRDVSLHLSLWPETYCISVDECIALGLTPIVTDIGAAAMRVRHGNGAFVVPHESIAKSASSLLIALSLVPGQWAGAKISAKDLIQNSKSHLDKISSVYDQFDKNAFCKGYNHHANNIDSKLPEWSRYINSADLERVWNNNSILDQTLQFSSANHTYIEGLEKLMGSSPRSASEISSVSIKRSCFGPKSMPKIESVQIDNSVLSDYKNGVVGEKRIDFICEKGACFINVVMSQPIECPVFFSFFDEINGRMLELESERVLTKEGKFSVFTSVDLNLSNVRKAEVGIHFQLFDSSFYLPTGICIQGLNQGSTFSRLSGSADAALSEACKPVLVNIDHVGKKLLDDSGTIFNTLVQYEVAELDGWIMADDPNLLVADIYFVSITDDGAEKTLLDPITRSDVMLLHKGQFAIGFKGLVRIKSSNPIQYGVLAIANDETFYGALV